MQREKNMAKTLNFVYAMILFVFLFLIIAKKDYGKLFVHPLRIYFFALKYVHNLLSCCSNNI